MKIKKLSVAVSAVLTLTLSVGALESREPVRTVPHELDALVNGGHVQGIACSAEGVYLSHSLGIEMVGWDGKFIRRVTAPDHLGDTAFADGRLYGAFCLRKAESFGGKPGLVRVWDAQLKTLAERTFDVPLDGITVLNGKVYVGVGTKDGAWHRGCRIKVLDLELNELEDVAVDFGYDIAYGVQTMSAVGNEIICGCYGGTSIGSADLKTWRRIGLNCGEGIDRVPRAVAGTDQPLYVVEKSENGGMRQWRKDPKNTPPVVRLDFFVYTNRSFRALSVGADGLPKATRVADGLRARLERNFDRMEEAKYRPQNVYLTMKQSGNWPGDTEGRTILALVCDARTTGREPKYLDEILRLLPSKVNEKGYLGPVFTDQIHEQQLSGNGWLLRGLCEHWLWKRDAASLAAVRRIARNLYLPLAGKFADYPVDPTVRQDVKGGESGHVAGRSGEWALSSDIGCVFIGLDGLVQAWEVTKDDDLRPAIDALIAKFLQMDVIAIKAQTHATLTGLRALLRYAKATGRKDLVGEVKKRFELYRRYGMTENYENYNWFCAYDKWTETCAVVDSFMVAIQLWEATDETQYLDLAHLIYWNGLCYLQRKNGGFGLDKTPGRGFGSPELCTHCSEAHWCCSMRGAEGLSAAAEASCVVRGADVVLAFPRSGAFVVDVGGRKVAFTCETSYPFAEEGRVVFLTDLPVGTHLKAYVPFVGLQDLGSGRRKGERVTFKCPTPTRTEGLVNPDNALDDYTVRRFRGPLLLGADGRTVYHLMDKDVWHRRTGKIRILQKKGE